MVSLLQENTDNKVTTVINQINDQATKVRGMKSGGASKVCIPGAR